MSDSISVLLESLLKAQAEFPPIERLVTGQAGPRKYKYADLSDIMNAVREPLARHGLLVTHEVLTVDTQTAVRTTLRHVSGESISTAIPINAALPPQQVGSAITYMRRYGLCALLAIVTEDDDDGQHSAPARAPVPAPKHTATKKLSDAQREVLQAAVTAHADRLCEFDEIDTPEKIAELEEVQTQIKLAAMASLGVERADLTQAHYTQLLDAFKRAERVDGVVVIGEMA